MALHLPAERRYINNKQHCYFVCESVWANQITLKPDRPRSRQSLQPKAMQSCTTHNKNSMLEVIKKTLWVTADKLRANRDAAEYRHLMLDLIVVKYVSDTFAARLTELTERSGNGNSRYAIDAFQRGRPAPGHHD